MGRERKGRVDRLPNGKYRARLAGEYLGQHQTRKLAQQRIRAALTLDAGDAPDTVRVYGRRVLAARDQSGAVRSSDDELSVWRTHIEKSFLADWALRAVKPRHVERLLAELTSKPAVSAIRKGKGTEYRPLGRTLSRQVITHVRRILRMVFARARIEGKVSQNPVDGVPVPKARDTVVEESDEWTYLTVAEIDALFAVLPDKRHKAFYGVAIYAGLRDGEILGLRWVDLQLDGARPALQIRKSRNGPTKTKRSRREVPMFPVLRELLVAWKEQAALARKARGDAAARPFDLVFPSDHGGCYSRGYDMGWADRKQRRVIRLPKPARKVARIGDLYVEEGWRTKAGIRDYVTFHCLRHTCASHLVMGTWTARPLSPMQVRDWLGHTHVSTTQRYAHLSPGNLHDAASADAEDAWKPDAAPAPPPRMDGA